MQSHTQLKPHKTSLAGFRVLGFVEASGKTLDVVTDPKTPTRLLPPPRPTTPDHDYISVDRNDDFDAVNRNHAFDNDFDLDMHEPGD